MEVHPSGMSHVPLMHTASSVGGVPKQAGLGLGLGLGVIEGGKLIIGIEVAGVTKVRFAGLILPNISIVVVNVAPFGLSERTLSAC